jgi:hypothetical protein
MRLTILTSYVSLKKIICYLFKCIECELNRLLAIFPNSRRSSNAARQAEEKIVKLKVQSSRFKVQSCKEKP